MKNRNALICTILSLIPIGQPLLIKSSIVISSSALMSSVVEKVNAENAEYYFKEAIKEYENKNFRSALSNINDAIRINPYLSKYYGIRASIYGRMNNFESSCADMRKAISMGDKIVPKYYSQFIKKGVC